MTSALVATVTLVALENLAVATILPVVSRHLGDLRLYGWVFSAFFLSSLLGTVIAGALADNTGIRGPIIGGLTLFGIGLLIAGTAPNMPVLVVGRLVQGVGAGAVPASAYVAIGRTYSESVRPRMFAVLSTAWVVPGLIGPALAAQVAQYFGWRWVFLGLIPAVTAAAMLTVPVLSRVPRPLGSRARSVPLASALVVAAGAAATLVGLSTGQLLPGVPVVVVGIGVLAAGLARLTPPGTLRVRPGVPAAVLIRGMLTYAYFAGDAYVPYTLTTVRHTSTTYAGVTLTIATLTWTTGAWFQARVVSRVGPRLLITWGLAIVLAAVGGLATVLDGSVPVWIAPLSWAVGGFGIGMAFSPISLTALGWARPGEEGRASSAIQLTDLLGTALGTGMAGAAISIVVAHGGTRRLGLLIAFSLAGLAALAGVITGPRVPATTSPADRVVAGDVPAPIEPPPA